MFVVLLLGRFWFQISIQKLAILTNGFRGFPQFLGFSTAATTGLLYQPRMIGDGDCGEICGMKIGRGDRSTRRKPAPVPLCPPQVPHG
jgi:hypothetical protein